MGWKKSEMNVGLSLYFDLSSLLIIIFYLDLIVFWFFHLLVTKDFIAHPYVKINNTHWKDTKKCDAQECNVQKSLKYFVYGG